jgi:hypothetical protein
MVAAAATANPAPVTATTTALTALGSDDGGEAALTYTWSSTGPAAVTFSANGTNAAKSSTATFARAGAYTFTVTMRDAANLTQTSTVNVTVNQTLTMLAVSPPTASVPAGTMQQFAGTGYDQFAMSLATQPAKAWTVAGGGTIDATGRFTADATVGGPYTVTATAGGKTGTAQVSVTGPNAPTVAQAASATPSPVTGTTTTATVIGASGAGEPALTYTWTSSGPAPVMVAPNGTNAAKTATIVRRRGQLHDDRADQGRAEPDRDKLGRRGRRRDADDGRISAHSRRRRQRRRTSPRPSPSVQQAGRVARRDGPRPVAADRRERRFTAGAMTSGPFRSRRPPRRGRHGAIVVAEMEDTAPTSRSSRERRGALRQRDDRDRCDRRSHRAQS